MKRLHVIDDHYLIIEGLYSSFDLESDDFEVVGGSLAVSMALREVNPQKVDIIILDLFIGNADPVSNLKDIQHAFPAIPVVILSHENCLAWQVKMFRSGIRAYISKSATKQSMIQTLNRVAAGEMVISGDVARVLFFEVEKGVCLNKIAGYEEIITDLTKGITVKEIAHKMRLSESAVEKKLSVIRKCFNVRTNAELIYRTFCNNNPA